MTHMAWAKDAAAAVGGAGAVTAVGVIALAQVDGFPPIDATQAHMVIWAIQVGGPLFGIIVLLLWFYRRDFRLALAESKERNLQSLELTKTVMELAKSSIAAMESGRASIDALTVELRRTMDYEERR
jgi:hypothetical protein